MAKQQKSVHDNYIAKSRDMELLEFMSSDESLRLSETIGKDQSLISQSELAQNLWKEGG